MTVQVALHTSRLPSLSGELGQPSLSGLTAWQSLLNCRPLLPAYSSSMSSLQEIMEGLEKEGRA